MYSYTWDVETGGLVLNSSPLRFSKEPRPVYYKELDVLGFDKYWNYDKNDEYPYMWAEANNYWYRGKLVAKTKGGKIYAKPEIVIIENPEPDGNRLRAIDISTMVEKNKDLMENLTGETIKKVYNTFMEFQQKVDVFYVAFSGGKDSIVTLDVVQRALPHNDFKVLFGDTGMEFPDTYDAVDAIENECQQKGIDFLRAKSKLTSDETWSKFGPPATVTRWCCSVHKTAPQILELRRMMGKPNFTGMAFIGIRASESLSRSEYDYVSLGEKHKGQYSCNPIIEWNSAEIYLYMYSEGLIINDAYKKGNRRAGCLVCPRAAERNDYLSRVWYTKEVDLLVDSIKDSYRNCFASRDKLDEFIANGGWKARKNGRDIDIEVNYSEIANKEIHTIKVNHPKTDWKTWIKTIGVLVTDESPYKIIFKNQQYEFVVIEEANGNLEVQYDISVAKENPLFIKLLKNVFRKSACCVFCQECEADCPYGHIHMEDNKLTISEECIHCSQCHKTEKGCLVYKSLEMPKGGLKMSATKSLNCYSHHAPKMDWITQFFNYKNDFDEKHSLGSQMYSFFKRFLRDAELLNKNEFSKTAEIIDKIGISELASWGIILTNLAYTPQVNWLIKRIEFNNCYMKDYTISLLIADGAKESWVKDIWSSLGRLMELPFKEVGLGINGKEKNRIISITRVAWENPEPLVVLYSLYKFAEHCGEYYQFTLSRLLNHEIDSAGVSPTEIFGIDRPHMEKILNGLTVNYPDFISAAFTLDLDNVTLRSDKTSQDVLELF